MTTLAYAAPTVDELSDPFIPIDPEDLDATRPVDLDVCPYCIDGAIPVMPGDPFTDAWDGEPCWDCGGTGVRSAA